VSEDTPGRREVKGSAAGSGGGSRGSGCGGGSGGWIAVDASPTPSRHLGESTASICILFCTKLKE